MYPCHATVVLFKQVEEPQEDAEQACEGLQSRLA
jgi:hypothetical protein